MFFQLYWSKWIAIYLKGLQKLETEQEGALQIAVRKDFPYSQGAVDLSNHAPSQPYAV